MSQPEGFKHDEDWQRHPFGCDCDLCYQKVLKNTLLMIELLKKKEDKSNART